MGVFRWRDEFKTGITTVDEDHRLIAKMIDQVGGLSSVTAFDDQALWRYLGSLEDLVSEHFANEERLMAQMSVDTRHADRHGAEHAAFLRQLALIKRSGGFDTSEALSALRDYLHSWFAHHVCGLDQRMARQVSAIADGTPPALAFEQDEEETSEAATVLLDALGNMVQQVAVRNLALADAEEMLRRANRTLEDHVQARTQELKQRNEELHDSLLKLEEAQHQLMQSERMASIGQLAAGIAHEINNPVGFVNSNLGTLKRYIADLLAVLSAYQDEEPRMDADVRNRMTQVRETADIGYLREDIMDLMEESREGLERVTHIIKDLKEFSHVDDGSWQSVDLQRGIESTLNVVWNELKYKAQVVREYADLPLVMCRPAQLNQVFMNLLVNSAHALQDTGTIWLRTGVEEDQVWVEVADDGCGMPEDVRRRIFDPFFTTKPVGEGTGLGLPLAYGIVKKHNGRIDVQSSPGQGTRFRVWLPVQQSKQVSDSVTAF